MTPLQRVVMAAKQVKHFCTEKVNGHYKIAYSKGADESLKRLARALDWIESKK